MVLTVQVYRCLCNTDTAIITTIVINTKVIGRRSLIITIQFHSCHGDLIIIHNIVCPEGKIPVRKGDIPSNVVIRLAPQNEICDIISTSVNKCHFLNNKVIKVISGCWSTNLIVSICGPRETPGEPACFYRHIKCWDGPVCVTNQRLFVVVIPFSPSLACCTRQGATFKYVLPRGSFKVLSSNLPHNPVTGAAVVVQKPFTAFNGKATRIHPAGDNSTTGLISYISIGIPTHPHGIVGVINIRLQICRSVGANKASFL